MVALYPLVKYILVPLIIKLTHNGFNGDSQFVKRLELSTLGCFLTAGKSQSVGARSGKHLNTNERLTDELYVVFRITSNVCVGVSPISPQNCMIARTSVRSVDAILRKTLALFKSCLICLKRRNDVQVMRQVHQTSCCDVATFQADFQAVNAFNWMCIVESDCKIGRASRTCYHGNSNVSCVLFFNIFHLNF